MSGSEKNIGIGNDISLNLLKRGYDIVNPDSKIIRISKTKTRLMGRSDPSEGLPKEKIIELEKEYGNNCPSKEYLYYGRNPLLIIYYIYPKNEEEFDEERFTSILDPSDEIKLMIDLHKNKYNYLIGYAIGFSKKYDPSIYGTDKVDDDNTLYIVNKSCNYYDKQHDEDFEKYGEE